MQKSPTIDRLTLYRGQPYKINKYIEVRIPTLEEICQYGENNYYSMVHTLCSVGIDLCWQLDEMGIDFEEISDYKLFYSMLCRKYDVSQTRILFGDKLDFTKMVPYINKEDESVSLVQHYLLSVPLVNDTVDPSDFIQIPVGAKVSIIETNDKYIEINYKGNIGYIMPMYISANDNGEGFISDEQNPEHIGNGIYDRIVIDEDIYYQIVSYLRAIHNLKRDDRVAGTRSCKRAFIEDAKMEYEVAKLEPRKSVLLPMISAMVNMDNFKRDDTTVWDMNIYAFMDSVKRTSKIKNATLLLQSGYSGFGIDLKKVNKDELDYMGELN